MMSNGTSDPCDDLGILGQVLRAQEDLHQVCTIYNQAFQLQQEMHYTYPVDEGLDGATGVAAAAGDPIRAACLFGAAYAIRRESVRDVPDDLKSSYERDAALARSQLSSERWQAAWEAGHVARRGGEVRACRMRPSPGCTRTTHSIPAVWPVSSFLNSL